MGSGCGKSSDSNQVVNPSPSVSSGGGVNDELAPYLSLESPYNVNHKYAMFFPILKDQRIGVGMRETFAFKSKIPEPELKKKRQEYWETRVEGKARMWLALKSACEANDAEAVGFLRAAGLKLVNKSLQMAYDSHGDKYDVPIFCINEPKLYDVPKETKFDKSDVKKATITVKLRCAGFTKDIEEKLDTDLPVESLKLLFLEKSKLNENPEVTDARLFYEGKELKPSHIVGEYGVQDDRVITVFIRKTMK